MFVCLGMLSACTATTEPNAVAVSEAVEAPEAVAEDTPQAADETSLFFRWDLGESTLISPPVTIQNEAIQNCRTLGYDTSYMINIGIEGDDAVAEFGCRGADQ